MAENLETDCRELLNIDISHLEIRQPLISVAITTHNREVLLPHAVMMQTFKALPELIIKNGFLQNGK